MPNSKESKSPVIMAVVKVTIKWGKDRMKGFEVDTEGTAAAFKEALYMKTGNSPVDIWTGPMH